MQHSGRTEEAGGETGAMGPVHRPGMKEHAEVVLTGQVMAVASFS